MQIFVVLQASDNAKEAEDNARKAKGAVKTVLNTITALLDQLGKNHVVVRARLMQRPPRQLLTLLVPPPQETSTEWI